MAVKKITIKAIEFVDCFRSGIDDAGLMKRYGLSANGLHVVYQHLLAARILRESEMKGHHLGGSGSVIIGTARVEQTTVTAKKPVIDAGDAIRCIRSGMDDAELMQRYNLSAKGVRSLFKKLVAKNILNQADLDKRNQNAVSEVLLDEQVITGSEVNQVITDENLMKLADQIRAGLSHKDLIEKYDYRPNRLQDMVKKLLHEGLLTRADLHRERRSGEEEFYIKNRFDDSIIFSGKASSLRSLVEEAVSRRIDLSNADLSNSDLSKADLSGAMMAKVDLSRAMLVGTDFTAANLREAKLTASDMFGAILYKSNMAKADLSDSNMAHVYAVWAFMADANLSEANLTCAELMGVNLAKANLFECILDGANLMGVYWEGARLEHVHGKV